MSDRNFTISDSSDDNFHPKFQFQEVWFCDHHFMLIFTKSRSFETNFTCNWKGFLCQQRLWKKLHAFFTQNWSAYPQIYDYMLSIFCCDLYYDINHPKMFSISESLLVSASLYFFSAFTITACITTQSSPVSEKFNECETIITFKCTRVMPSKFASLSHLYIVESCSRLRHFGVKINFSTSPILRERLRHFNASLTENDSL